jgi:pyrroline-5-carboxylate reductase
MAADLVVMGGGRMGEALVGGLLASGSRHPRSVAVVEPDATRRDALLGPDGVAGRHPGLTVAAAVTDIPDTGRGPGLAAGFGAVIAVKPGDVPAACQALRPAGPARVLSVAAGVTLDALGASLHGADDPGGGGSAGTGPALLRAMPNTPALIGAGAAGLAAGPGAGPEDVAWAEGILGAVGLVVRVAEQHLDAVTGLSGSGPAYVFLVAEALIDAGVLVGLSRPVAEALATQTLLGAARMLDEGTDGPGALRAAVTSPGGTTAAGLRALEDRAVRAAFADAVVAATERSRQLGV